MTATSTEAPRVSTELEALLAALADPELAATMESLRDIPLTEGQERGLTFWGQVTR
jgi:hypothetical protein